MKAAYIEETGPPENIIYGDLPQPEPADNQVLVEVRAVALNPVDTYIRNGANYWELPQPFVVGCDLAGTVSAVGSGAKQFQVGDRVWGTNQGLLGRQGTFAEYCAVDECWLYPIPENVSDEAAAACSLVGVTAHLGLFRDAKLKTSETVFVHGGTGGVGSRSFKISMIRSAFSAMRIDFCSGKRKTKEWIFAGLFFEMPGFDSEDKPHLSRAGA